MLIDNKNKERQHSNPTNLLYQYVTVTDFYVKSCPQLYEVTSCSV